MKTQINKLELASELADLRVIELYPLESDRIQEQKNKDILYTEKAQDIFNVWYDYYLIHIGKASIKKNSLNIDYKKLGKQKLTLVKLVTSYKEFFKKNVINHLQGVINLIDAIEDVELNAIEYLKI